MWRHLREALRSAVRVPGLRRLLGESMGFEGVFHAVKDYLQPVLQALVLGGLASTLVDAELSDVGATALVVGPVYFVLHLLSAVGSRQAHRAAAVAGSEDRAARLLWGASAMLFAGLTAAAWGEAHAGVAVAFVLLYTLQNVWRPILVSRIDAHTEGSRGATVLSIESQAQKTVTMIAAPLLGAAVDLVQTHGPGGAFWPVGLLGAVVSAAFFLLPHGARIVRASPQE